MHQVVDRLADEGVLINPSSADRPIQAEPARRGDAVDVVGIIETAQGVADREHLVRVKSAATDARAGQAT